MFIQPEAEAIEQTQSNAAGAIPKEARMTTPYMTKYEKARLLGTRALQISMNAPVMVDLAGESDPLEIAMKELREKKIPLVEIKSNFFLIIARSQVFTRRKLGRLVRY